MSITPLSQMTDVSKLLVSVAEAAIIKLIVDCMAF